MKGKFRYDRWKNFMSNVSVNSYHSLSKSQYYKGTIEEFMESPIPEIESDHESSSDSDDDECSTSGSESDQVMSDFVHWYSPQG